MTTIKPTTILPSYANLYNLTKAELKEYAQHFGLNIKGTKDDFIDALKAPVAAHNEAAKKLIEQETLENERAAQQRLDEAKADYRQNLGVLQGVVQAIDELVETSRIHIEQFTNDVAKHGVSHAIRHYSEAALKAEEQINCYMTLRRFILRDDITLAQKLDGIKSQFENSLNRLTDTSDTSQLRIHQFSYKVHKHFHTVLTADKVDLSKLTFFFA